MSRQHSPIQADQRIARRVSAVSAGGQPQSGLLSDWRDAPAYVLLGDPGAGKSEALRMEFEATGGVYRRARDFVDLGLDAEDVGKTLFIDGLDEMRAGAVGAEAALSAIRARLNALGRPRFRLSCREYDWRAQSDLEDLRLVAPGGAIEELHLEPLTRDEQHQILLARQAEIGDADAFLRRAERNGLDALFGNPLLLDLTIRAVASADRQPESRRDIYELACRQLATEHERRHRDARPKQPGDLERLLDDAGLLCAVLLLSGKSALTREPQGRASVVPIHTLPAQLAMHDPTAALASKLFKTTDGEPAPIHRSIAEYLAGKAIATRVQAGGRLPLGRVLALMQGEDGRVVEPLRGLLGWLAIHDAHDRQELTRLDPMAVVLNGDLAVFSALDKRALLEDLRGEAQRNLWFRNGHWVSWPFAPLATADMADALGEVLANHSTDDRHQALVDCVLDALRQGSVREVLRPLLTAWVEDSGAWFGNRMGALQAWARCEPFDTVKARSWLDRLRSGELKDKDARLTAELLRLLYPADLGPESVLSYWPRSEDISLNSMDPSFWYSGLIEQSRPEDFALLADSWLLLQPPARSPHRDSAWKRLKSTILARALAHAGDQIADDKLYAWLGIGIDEHGLSRLDHDGDGKLVAQWLAEHPARLKAVVAMGWRATPVDPKTGRRFFWESEQRLHLAQRPHDWLFWLLEQAADAPNSEMANYCFCEVARAAIEPPPGFDVPSLSQVEAWVAAHAERWPDAARWLQDCWTSPLQGNWRRDEERRQRKDRAHALTASAARQKAIAPHLDAIVAGTASAHLMQQLAHAHEDRFYDIHGETPEQRVQDWLVSDPETARAAIAGLSHVLTREDLPSADEVLAFDAKRKYHLLQPAALLAASLAHADDPGLVLRWSERLLSTLVASWLMDGTGELPAWYRDAVEVRPDLVAPLLVRHAQMRLRRKGTPDVTGLWALANEPGHAALARLALPSLLQGFPHRASEAALRELNRSLLAAIHLLDDAQAAGIVRDKLQQASITAAQRISWLVAGLPYIEGAVDQLMALVANNERRAVALGIALHEQGSLGRAQTRLPAATLARLVEVLAPITKPALPLGAFWVGPVDQRRDTVRALIARLANDPHPEAAAALQHLSGLPILRPWELALRHGSLSQQSVSREVHFAHPTAEAAALTLANAAPANPADLLALTLDHLHDIERRLRGADTFELRLFWTTHGNASTHQREPECSKLLLAKLTERMQAMGMHVVPERLEADDKRADLRVEYTAGGNLVALPVEIKLEDHKGLWLAWRDQLQRLYTIDPAADGHGIYLVLWFGRKPRASPDGFRPTSAVDLQQHLSARIPPEDRKKLVVKVLDLSLPD